MPVIRGRTNVSILSAERRDELVRQLKQELVGHRGADAPVIYEIPLDRSKKLDVVVVWDAFDSLASEDRRSITARALELFY